MNPRRTVEVILADLEVTKPPVDMLAIANDFHLPVIPWTKDFLVGCGLTAEETTYVQANFEGIFAQLSRCAVGVNANRKFTRWNFDLAHEVSHYLLGHGTTAPEMLLTADYQKRHGYERDPDEVEASRLAAELLMPTQFFIAAVDEIRAIPHMPGVRKREALAETFGVAVAAVRKRFRELELEPV